MPSKADAAKQVWNHPAARKIRTQVIVALADPATRKKLVAHADALNEKAREWLEEHRADERSEDKTAPKGYFGQRRLEARCRHMVELLDSFGQAAPEVASALEPVRASVYQVESALKVSSGLPLVKRKQAHFQIDDQLDEIERTVLAAVLGSDAADD